jgi:hypothetical protein
VRDFDDECSLQANAVVETLRAAAKIHTNPNCEGLILAARNSANVSQNLICLKTEGLRYEDLNEECLQANALVETLRVAVEVCSNAELGGLIQAALNSAEILQGLLIERYCEQGKADVATLEAERLAA